MTAITAKRLTWSLIMLSLILAILTVILALAVHGTRHTAVPDMNGGLPVLAFPFVVMVLGALIVSRQPRNPIGWIFTGTGFLVSLGFYAGAYANIGQANPGILSGVAPAAWYSDLVQGPILFGPFVFLFLLFPNGHLLSPRWRAISWLALAAVVAVTLGASLQPGHLGTFPSIINPFGLADARSILQTVSNFGFILQLATFVAAVASMILRFRRSRGEERLQLKWFATSAAFVGVVVVSGPILWQLPNPIWTIAFALAAASVPIAIGVSMLKYRLYEIDVIINRALVYGSLTVSLGALYIGGVFGLQALFRVVTGQSSELAVAVATLAIAALFNPWRHRVQRYIDRRFYRHKYDAVRTLSAFSSHLRDEVDLDHLSGEILTVVQETMHPASATLWLSGAALSDPEGAAP